MVLYLNKLESLSLKNTMSQISINVINIFYLVFQLSPFERGHGTLRKPKMVYAKFD